MKTSSIIPLTLGRSTESSIWGRGVGSGGGRGPGGFKAGSLKKTHIVKKKRKKNSRRKWTQTSHFLFPRSPSAASLQM